MWGILNFPRWTWEFHSSSWLVNIDLITERQVDKMLVSTKKYLYFSYFSMKNMLLVLIEIAS